MQASRSSEQLLIPARSLNLATLQQFVAENPNHPLLEDARLIIAEMI